MRPLTESNNYRTSIEEIPPRRGEFRRFIRVFFDRRIVIFFTLIIFALIVIAIFAPLLSPYDPYDQDLAKSLQHPSREHLLGNDPLGRDVLSRIIYGTRISLLVGGVVVSIAATIGIILGLVAGYFGGWVNNVIMRFIDALMAIPSIMLALAIAAVLGGGLRNIIISLGVALVPTYCRLMCGQVLSVKESDHVTASIAMGASNMRTMFVHVLPNCFPPMIVLITLNMGSAILAEAGLSFLGVGIAPPGAAWGAMISTGYRYLLTNPLLSLAPGICVILVVMSFNIVGDSMRDALDPRLRGTI